MGTVFFRDIEQRVKDNLFESGFITLIYGPRRVGKTTFCKKILNDYHSENGYFDCETHRVANILTSNDPDIIRDFFGKREIIVLDEAQVIPEIGKILKLLIDTYPNLNIIASGSSSFDLANQVGEPLVGRNHRYMLYPVSFSELAKNTDTFEVWSRLERIMIYGSYPYVLTASSLDDQKERLLDLVDGYLFKDVFKFKSLKHPKVLTDLLTALAFQVGNEVSYNELANLLEVNKETVQNYIELLKQTFIIFERTSYSSNLRNEIKGKRKFFFYDNGVISVLIDNFSPLELRNDVGALWENLMMSERVKYNQANRRYGSSFFWRVQNSGEIDLIERYDGILHPYEFKWKSAKVKRSSYNFNKFYANSTPLTVINNQNFYKFLMDDLPSMQSSLNPEVHPGAE
jgi:predicted AAA+ superfamily ATPase